MSHHHSQLPLPSLPTATLLRGLEVRVDLRLATLAAALTAASAPVAGEHALVSSTRTYLHASRGHPAVHWLQSAVEQTWLLSVGMQTVQLRSPPTFTAPPQSDIPWFVLRDFAEPAAQELAPHLATFWQDTQLAHLFAQQTPVWTDVVATTATILDGLDIVGFEERFFGLFPYHPVVVPLVNLVPSGTNGIGVANQHETYAVCCRITADDGRLASTPVIELAQHESSHPVLEHLLQRFPAVPAACAFVEAAHPPSERFATIYDTPESRWTETFVRASTWCFLTDLGRNQEAADHLQRHMQMGAQMIATFVHALSPWWHERRAGRAPGLDQALDQFPDWLHAVA
jgi:hypothetical protein